MRVSREEGAYQRGAEGADGRGFSDSCGRGPRALHYARPRRSLPPSPPPHRASEQPPAAQVAQSARPSCRLSSPDEARRRPGLALSIFSTAGSSSPTSRRCHLRTPRAAASQREERRRWGKQTARRAKRQRQCPERQDIRWCRTSGGCSGNPWLLSVSCCAGRTVCAHAGLLVLVSCCSAPLGISGLLSVRTLMLGRLAGFPGCGTCALKTTGERKL